MNEAVNNASMRTLQIKTGELDEAAFGPIRTDPVLLNVISGTTGVPVEALQRDTASGATLGESIAARGRDLEAVTTALRETFSEAGWAGDDLDQRIDSLLSRPFGQVPAEE